MQSRRSLRLVAGALLLATPLLGSCGFGKATDRPYTPGEGTNSREGEVKVLSAVVVSAQPESGTFIASLTNNGEEETSFDGLAGAGDWAQALTVGEVDPVELPPRGGFANLAEEGGVTVSGAFEPGDVVSLALTFGSDTVTMSVPIVYACDEYAGLDESAGAEASEEPTETESPSPGDVPTEEETPTEEPTTSAEAYDCEAALEEEH